jgi:hypothetical protein
VSLAEPFSPAPGLEIAAGLYSYTRYTFWWSADASRPVSGSLLVASGKYFLGSLHTISPSFTVRPIPHIGVSVSWERNWLHNVAGTGRNRVAEVINSEARLSLDPSLHSTLFRQYDALTRRSRTFVRLSWEHRPLSYVHVIFDSGGGEGGEKPAALIKLSYVAQF